MVDQSDRGKETLIRLEQALQRLVDGQPIKTKPDGRISLKRINDEAGLSSGGIYYYSSFVDSANQIIESKRQEVTNDKKPVNVVREKKLREQRDKQKLLKEKYKEQRDQIKDFCDQVVAHNAQLEFTLFEALEKISYLEQEVTSNKVTSISGKKS